MRIADRGLRIEDCGLRIETANWSGEGEFTQLLIDRLRAMEAIDYLRVENAPATRSEADYQFISNEIFIAFASVERRERFKRLRFLPATRTLIEKAMTMSGLESALTAMEDVGAPDFSDQAMLQYLRTERIVPLYQSRGYKMVELVRIYEVGAVRRS